MVANGNHLIMEQLGFNREEMTARVTANKAQFNDPQRRVYEAVIASVDNNNGKLFFLHSTGSCGKTFLCNTIAAAVHAQEKIAFCVASSGMALLLLDVVIQLTPLFTFLFKSMTHQLAILAAGPMLFLFFARPQLSFGMKFLCSTSMLLMLLIKLFEIFFPMTLHLVALQFCWVETFAKHF